MNAVDLVEEAGFEAIAATNADAAIQILITRTDIRIVMTDVDMPGSMDGLRLAAAVRGRWPPIEIIVMCDRRRLTSSDLPERAHFLSKPYSANRLTKTLQTLAA